MNVIWNEDPAGGAWGRAQLTDGREMTLVVKPMRRGVWLWEVIDRGSDNRLPSCEAGVTLTIAEGKSEAEAIVNGWAS